MDDGLKQRIVGAFVLLVLAIIFVPVVFNRERIEPLERKTLIPPAPIIEPVVIGAPEVESEDIEPAEQIEEIFLPDETKIVTSATTPIQTSVQSSNVEPADGQAPTAEPSAPQTTSPKIEQSQTKSKLASDEADSVLNSKGVPQGWVLQVASYQSANRAVAMRDELLGEGYAAYIRSVTTAGGKMSRVYVGPKLDKKKLDIEKAAIEQKYGIKTLMLVFEP